MGYKIGDQIAFKTKTGEVVSFRVKGTGKSKGPKRAPNAYARFVQENWGWVFQQRKGNFKKTSETLSDLWKQESKGAKNRRR